jgi:hypothetical protein
MRDRVFAPLEFLERLPRCAHLGTADARVAPAAPGPWLVQRHRIIIDYSLRALYVGTPAQYAQARQQRLANDELVAAQDRGTHLGGALGPSVLSPWFAP